MLQKLILPVFMIRAIGSLSLLIFTYVLVAKIPSMDVGHFFWATSIIFILSTISRLGVDSILVSDLSIVNDKNILSEKFSTYIFLTIFLCLIVSTTAYNVFQLMISMGILTLDHQIIRIIVLAVFPISLSILYSELQKSQSKALSAVLFRFTLGPIALLIVCLFGSMNNSYTALQYYIVVISLMVILQISISRGLIVCQGISFKTFKPIVARSFPLLLIATCGMFVGWLDLAVLGFLQTPDQVAYYAVAARTSVIFSLIGTTILTIYSPRISHLVSNSSWPELSRLLRQIMYYAGITSIGLLLLISISGKYLLSLLGEDYTASFIPLILLAIAHGINAAFGPVGYVMVAMDMSKSFAKLYLMTSALIMPLYVVVIPEYGAVGAASLAVFYFLSINLLCYTFINKHISHAMKQQST